jgi:hypothetical protein
MQKFLPFIVVVLVSLVLWFSITSKGNKGETSQPAANTTQANNSQANNAPESAAEPNGTLAGTNPDTQAISASADIDSEEGAEFDDRPATEKFKTADEALNALKEAAAIYDDLVLDQFTAPGESCSWCDSVYSSVKDLMLSPDVKADQKAFYAEILAISGRVDNLKSLVEAAKSAQNPDEASLYAEALELATGKEEVITFLTEQLTDSNSTIKEASVAALTNQGSKKAVENLYNFSVAQGNSDGFYELGIGVGEMVPDEEAYSFLQQKALQKDEFSHLAVKALLNVGLEGVKMVSDLYSGADSPEFVKKVLEQSKDHVAFDDETLEYLKAQSANPKNAALGEWYSSLLKEYELSEQELLEEGAEEAPLFTPLEPE